MFRKPVTPLPWPLVASRLKRVLPQLRDKLTAALATERRERYLADYERVETRRNTAAEKLRTTRQLQEQIIQIYRECEEVDKEISRLHGDAPDDCQERIRLTELFARDLASFSGNKSLVKSTMLFDWKSGDQIWPPASWILRRRHSRRDAVSVARGRYQRTRRPELGAPRSSGALRQTRHAGEGRSSCILSGRN
jgi:hypothetical protein